MRPLVVMSEHPPVATCCTLPCNTLRAIKLKSKCYRFVHIKLRPAFAFPSLRFNSQTIVIIWIKITRSSRLLIDIRSRRGGRSARRWLLRTGMSGPAGVPVTYVGYNHCKHRFPFFSISSLINPTNSLTIVFFVRSTALACACACVLS